MDDLIKELIEEIKKEKKGKKINKASKIVAKVNEDGCVETIGVNGNKTALLSTICIILREMEKHSDDSAEHMAMIILTTLELEKEIND